MPVDRFVSLLHFKMPPITSFAQQSWYWPPSPLTAISPSPTTALDMQRSLTAHRSTTPMPTMDIESMFSMIATGMNLEGASPEPAPAALPLEVTRLVITICVSLAFLLFRYVKYKRSFARASDHVASPELRFSAGEFHPGM